MPATNYTPIQLYRSTTSGNIPNAANLSAGEIALNIADNDMTMYFENASGVVKSFFNNPAALKYPTADGTSGQIIQTNGAGVLSFATAGGGANIQSFSATGTYTKPPGAKFVMVEVWGAGAGGGFPPGAVCPCNSKRGSWGGGGGAYTTKVFAAPDVGATETVTVGAGGAGGAGSGPTPSRAGGSGGTTNFGTLLYAFGGGNCAPLGNRSNGTALFKVSPYQRIIYCAALNSPNAAGILGIGINLSIWGGGVGGTNGKSPTGAPKNSAGMSVFGGGGGGGGGQGLFPPCCTGPAASGGGAGGLGRALGRGTSAPGSCTIGPNCICTNQSFGRGGGAAGGGVGAAGCAAPGPSFSGGGGGGGGNPSPAGTGGAGGLAGGGGGGGGIWPNTTGTGGAGGNGYAIVYTW